jgi:hypothetical protein
MKTITSKCANLLSVVLVAVFSLGTFYSSLGQSVGINTPTPLSSFEVNGSFGQTVTTITSNVTLNATQSIVICNNGSNQITVSLPVASTCAGRTYSIKRNSSSTAQVRIIGAIDGALNLYLKNPCESATLISNGTEWNTINGSNSSMAWGTLGTANTDSTINFLGTTDSKPLFFRTNNVKRLGIATNGNIGIGMQTPTAYLHIKPGTAAAGTAPLKFTSGTLLTTPEKGTIEFKGQTFYATTSAERRSIVLAQNVVATPISVASSSTETTIYTSTMAANYLTVGKLINIKLFGRFTTNGTGQLYTIRVKLGTTTLLTKTSTSQSGTDRPWEVDLRTIVRSIGATGTVMTFGKTQQDVLTPSIGVTPVTTVNTTLSNTITVTIQWNVASANNSFTLEGGATECIDQNN